jgi:4-hydroxythreonine-4-phosphate dehydrogenase
MSHANGARRRSGARERVSGSPRGEAPRIRPVPKPRIGITVGDPAGIGPEIAIKAAADARILGVCEPRLYGPHTPQALAPFRRGEGSAEAGRAAYDAIVAAVADARRGAIDAIATAPINKEAFALAGLPWKGHTDLLAHLTGAPRVAMMFHAEALRVVLATIHVPLAEVPRLLTRDLVDGIVDLTAREMPRFGYPRPRLALAGLNPHAGEHGVIGGEDEAVLRPAVEAARGRGIDITGPWPGDTVFVRASRGEFDAVIACYHDQGLIPVKLLAFGRAVNVTLGLPIIRTSVDHGTAFDIAGRGVADESSLVEAIRLAATLVGSGDHPA